MKFIYKVLLYFGVNLFAVCGIAQQDPNYTFYRYNMNLINPAFAGSEETTDLGVNIRSQWASIEGAPETQSFVFGTPLRRNLGLGVSIVNDKTFIESHTAFALDVSYKLQLSESTDLFFGIKAGFSSYDANTQGLVTYSIQSDPNLSNIDGRFNPNVGAGFYLKNEAYFLSFSIPKILTPDRLEQKDGLARLGVDKVHLYVAGGYNFELTHNLVLKPTALIRYVDAAPLSVDLTAILEFNQRIDLGAAYRYDESISGIFLFKAMAGLQIGYAYEMAMESAVSNIDNGTHEILFRLRL
ncbi:type IX secretion system membrane protein PorP/SprF [Arenibacter sp. GZD96]|uniref:PorP/SprF family type IX secretion system membrane protein n=1 Tax=Aurantibrevibacter litoralis TaxID=3106030 RepID=UPI002AFEE51F|nr:type IX secretion system membrane protein PorP/SprF [Arenibacter sp. GZD-96]MEA1786168.1 type IX secretion system membrane protein PorP/SprF [Arenibacter sp. GZD-96]